MSYDLAESLRESLETTGVLLSHLGPSFAVMKPRGAQTLQGLLCELSDEALAGYADREPAVLSLPCAGLPVVTHADDLASEAGIGTVIRGPEDLAQWISSLDPGSVAPSASSAGHIIAIWGPAGSPGRSTIALCLAATLAVRGERVILVDGDSYAPSLAPLLGLHPAQSGVVSLSRHARIDNPDATALEACGVHCQLGSQSFSVITGLSSPSQYVDCGALPWSNALTTLRAAGHTLVVDVAAPLLQLPGETIGGPMRNALTLATLEVADRVIVVANPIPLSILRLSRDWPRLRELAPVAALDVLLNKVPANSQGSIDDSLHALWQFTGRDEAIILPHDRTWSGSSDTVNALLSAPNRKNLLMTSVGRFATAQTGTVPKPAARPRPSSATDQPKWSFSLPNWATDKKRLP